jgi:hypothetical protein
MQRREQYLTANEAHTGKVQRNEKALKQSAEQVQQEKLNVFQGNAQSDGLDMPTLNNAVNVVVGSGVSPDIADFLLTDKVGPKLAIELAANPMALQEIVGMSSMNAAIKLNAMSQSLKTTKTDPPPPPEVIGGNGKASIDDFDNYGQFS